MPMMLELISIPSAAGGVSMLAPRFVSWGRSAIATTMPTARTFESALSPSLAMRMPNTFLNPVTGLIFLKSGLIACAVGLNDTWATFTITPAAMHKPAIGATVVRIVCIPAENSSCRPAAVV